jgi:DHA1 family quinolone resistance protein-like MFS transporter
MNSIQHIQRTYYLIISLFWLAIALPIALIILLGQARGLDLFQVGLLMGIYSLTIVLLEVPTGGLADAIGRKRVAVIAYSCMTVSGILTLFAFSFPVFLAAFILNGIGRALSSGALDAWFVDTLQAEDPEVDLQPLLAKAGTFSLLSLGLGALSGSFIPRLFSGLPADGTAVLTPFSMPILFAIATKMVLLALTILLVKEDLAFTRASDWKQGFREVPAIIRTGFTLSRHNPTILLLLGTTLASGLALISLESFWQPNFADLLGGSQGNSLFFGVVMGGNFLAGMVGNLLATPISRLLNKRYGLVCAIFQGIWGVAIILLALQTGLPFAVFFFWLAYMNMGVINSPHNTLLNREIPAEQRSSMLSIASLAGYVGAMIGGAGLGYVAEHASISTAWIISGVVLVASLGLYWRVDVRQSKQLLRLKRSVAEV